MDSLSQMVLGAAVGEAAFGKKLGNRAMLWGAIGGTIPDLDVLASPFMSEVNALAFHRGISHSIFFSVVGGLVMGYLIHSIYRSRHHKWIGIGMRSALLALIAGTVLYVGMSSSLWPVYLLLTAGAVGVAAGWMHNRYFDQPQIKPDLSFMDWSILMFLALFTHDLLDCFTAYGTQLFAPFSNARVAWSTISVADPLYTAPFFFFLLAALFYDRDSDKRRILNWAGIAISCAYLAFTVYNKQRVDHVFKRQLAQQNIVYTDYLSTPSILNNILWSATVKTDSIYYQGQYSLFDKSPIVFNPIPKNHDLIEGWETDRTLKTLQWFSKGFYNVIRRTDGKYQVNDLRYGTFRGNGNGESDYIFRFPLDKDSEGNYYVLDAEGGPPEGEEKKLMRDLWTRIKGI